MSLSRFGYSRLVFRYRNRVPGENGEAEDVGVQDEGAVLGPAQIAAANAASQTPRMRAELFQNGKHPST